MEKNILVIEGMEFYAKHGLFDYEKQNGTNFIVDVYVTTDLTHAGISDELADTVDYTHIYKIVEETMQDSKNLIEHLGYHILEQIAIQVKDIQHVKVRVSKMNPPVPGNVKRTFVEFERSINDAKTSDGYWEERARY